MFVDVVAMFSTIPRFVEDLYLIGAPYHTQPGSAMW